MANIIDYAVYVIDLTNAMLEHRKGLNLQQIDHIETINRRAVDFVTEYLLHEKADLDTLFSYLNHDTMQPISVIVGYSEFMLMGGAGGLLPQYREAIEEIRDCGYYLREGMQNILEELTEFMDNIGYERKPRVPAYETPQAVQPKPIQPIRVQQNSQERGIKPLVTPPPTNVAPSHTKPIRRLQPQA